VSLLDNTMQNIQKVFVMEGVWIQSLGQVQFNYSNGGAQLATCAATFEYQYFYPAEDAEKPTESDPLAMANVMKALGNM